MRTVYRRGLPALLTVALTAGAVGAGTPALAAGDAPTGTFTLNVNAIWAGQQVKLTQETLTDDDVDPATVSRVINWGDGTTTSAAAGETSWTHAYTTVKAYGVSVTLNDGEVEGPGTIAAPTVAVTTAPGTLGWQKSPVWTLPGYYGEAVFAPTNLPATADQAWTDWRDGEFTLLKQGATSTTAPHWYPTGNHTPSVQLENRNGKATPRFANPLSVQNDTTDPNSAFTWPAAGTRNASSSYKTLRGTGSDGQSGADIAEVFVVKYNATTLAYWDFAKKNWIAITREDQPIPATASGYSPVSASGTWAVPVSGFSKGWQVDAYYWVYDKVGNYSADKYASFYLSS
jgi:hypothetical protein